MSPGARLEDAELLARLVGFDSTSCNSNRPIADFVCDYLDRPGVRIERQPYPEDDKVNVVVTVGPEPDPERREGLVLSGHFDVVPALEPGWQSDPFTLVETDEGYRGRGACDMKGFVTLAINAALRALEAGELRHPLTLLLTCDEEVGTLGARHFVKHWPEERALPRHAIIGEPTSLEVVRMHKGHGKMRLVVNGRGAHSGYPHLGENAIEAILPALNALSDLRARLEQEAVPNGEHFPAVPFVALNLALLRGGVAINIVPDRCQLDLGFRVLPGMRTEDLVATVRRTVEEALGDRVSYELVDGGHSPPMLLEEDHELHRYLCGLMDQEGTRSASYATDAGWFQEGGFECLLWGPGTIEVAHKPNEWIPKEEFHRASRLLDRIVAERCGAGAA
jgi:acetylornithine deacetylase